MKLVFLTSLLLITTSCSHASNTAPQAAPASAPATAKAATKAPGAKHELAASAKKTTVANANADHATCKSSSEIRELIVVPMGAGGCELDYTKAKETKKIATAEHETGLCQQVLGKVRGHLEAAGFRCN